MPDHEAEPYPPTTVAYGQRYTDLHRTDHGFRFGAMVVEATASIGETSVITVTTDAGLSIDIYCSPTGRSLRVFRHGKGSHGEMKVTP